jgi:hypothetical protein
MRPTYQRSLWLRRAKTLEGKALDLRQMIEDAEGDETPAYEHAANVVTAACELVTHLESR